MTAIVSLFGFVARFAGDLLNTATGWAGTLMFGRVPQSHRRYLTAILGGSVLWVILVIVFLVPGILRWGLQTTPHPSFITSSWLAFVTTLGVVLVPLAVGLAAWMAPADENRATGLRGGLEPVRGYLLAPAIGGLLVFLAGVGVVRKVRSARHRWSDTHIPIVVPPGGYADTVDTIHEALADAGFPLEPRPASPLLSLPAWVLTHLAAPNVRRVRPDRVIELRGTDMRVGIYPSDVAVSTTGELRTPIRAAILAAMSGADAHLTTSAEAQDVEDRLKRSRPTHKTLAVLGTKSRRSPPSTGRCSRWTSPTRSGTSSIGCVSRPSVTCCGGRSAGPRSSTRSRSTRRSARPAPRPSTTPNPDAGTASPRSPRCDRNADPGPGTVRIRRPSRHAVDGLANPRDPGPGELRGAHRRPGQRRRLPLRPNAARRREGLGRSEGHLERRVAIGELPAHLPRGGVRAAG